VVTAIRSAVDRVLLLCVALVALMLPFELRAPLFSLGPIVVTNLELVLYVTIALTICSWLIRDRSTRFLTVAHVAVVVWICAVGLTAAVAPTGRGAAIKFALRSTGGCLLFFAAAETVRSTRRAAVVGAALGAGAIVSAVFGILDVWAPASRVVLAPFREQNAFVGGFIRASGTFDYPNTAAMYWEAVLPLIVGTGAWLTVTKRTHAARIGATVALGVVVLAIVLSLSRASLFVTFVTLIALAGVGQLVVSPMRGYALAALAGLIVFAAAPATGGTAALRMRSNHPAEWYRPHYTITPASATLEAQTAADFDVEIRNVGLVTWPATGGERVAVSYYWEDTANAQNRIFSGARIALPKDVAPNDSVTVRLRATAPDAAGAYRLRVDMLLEDVAWFNFFGADTGNVPVTVTAAPRPVLPVTRGEDTTAVPEERADRLELWTTAFRMWRERPLFGIGPDNFRHLHDRYSQRKYPDQRTHANSLYVETLATMGVTGVAAWLLLVGALARHIARGWLAFESVARRTMITAFTVGLTAFFIHGLVDYFLIFTPTYGLFWLLAGSAVGITSLPRAGASADGDDTRNSVSAPRWPTAVSPGPSRSHT
jgi:hypothetical protein